MEFLLSSFEIFDLRTRRKKNYYKNGVNWKRNSDYNFIYFNMSVLTLWVKMEIEKRKATPIAEMGFSSVVNSSMWYALVVCQEYSLAGSWLLLFICTCGVLVSKKEQRSVILYLVVEGDRFRGSVRKVVYGEHAPAFLARSLVEFR